MEQRIQNIEKSCEKRFDLQGERLVRECEKFKQYQNCDKEKFINQCMGGIKKEDFKEKREGECDISECGPQLGMPNHLCPDGKTTAGPTGRCLRHEDGKCGWEVISCPTTTITKTYCGSGKPDYDCYCNFGEIKQEYAHQCPEGLSCPAVMYYKCVTVSSPTSTTTCPQLTPPLKKEGCTYTPKYDANKCIIGYDEKCVSSCPSVQKPTCNAGETLQAYYDTAGCVTNYQCIKQTTTCLPVECAAPPQGCSYSGGTDANGCRTCGNLVCPSCTKPTCSGAVDSGKRDSNNCIIYSCPSNSTTITGTVVLSTYDDYLRHCENSWVEQQRICTNTPSVCDKNTFIEKCKEQEQKNAADYSAKIEQHCDTDTISEIKHAEQRCSKIDEEKQRCLEQSAKRCEQMKGLADKCKETLTEEKLRNFIVEEVKKRCKFTNLIENEDEVRKSEKAEVVLAVLNTATQSDFDKLKLFVDNLKEDLKLQDTTVYKGTIDPNRFGDLKQLPFVVNAKLSAVESSERAKEVKEKIVAGQKSEDVATKLVSLRDSDVPKEYLYIIEDKASDVLNVSGKLSEIEKKEEQKGLGYKIRLFLGLAKKAEQEEINQLQESKEKLSNSIDALTKLVDEVPSDVVKSILKEQVESLKKQQEDIDALIKAKEKKAKGLLGIFG